MEETKIIGIILVILGILLILPIVTIIGGVVLIVIGIALIISNAENQIEQRKDIKIKRNKR